jgi:hypothetical protein
MSSKQKKIYHALVEGATEGMTDNKLFKHVMSECPKATSKKIVKASLLALSDPDLKDGSVLQVIYALAIKHRLDPWVKEDHDPEEEEVVEVVEVKKPKRSRAAAPATH